VADLGAPGRIIDNPISGERIVIHTSAAQTGGALLAFDLFLPPGGHVPARHVHPMQEEKFTIVDGELCFQLGRRTVLATRGQTVLIPRGKAHWFGNKGAQVAHARVEVRPALRMEELLATTETLARSSRLCGTRLPSLPHLAAVLLEFHRELAVPVVPAAVVRIVLRPLAWFSRRRPLTRRPASLEP